MSLIVMKSVLPTVAQVTDGGIADMSGVGGPRARASSTGGASESFTETDTGVESSAFTTASEAIRRNIITVEEKAEGAVSYKVYLAHFKAMGGWPMFLLVAFGVFGAQAAVTCSDYWLAYWSSGTVPRGLFDRNKTYGTNFYIAGLGVISAAAFLLLILRSTFLAYASTRASFRHHDGVLRSILAAPMTFFDTTPGEVVLQLLKHARRILIVALVCPTVGRILNRLSKDTDQIDMGLPNQLGNAWSVVAVVLGNFVAVSITQPYFLLAMFGVIVLLLFLQHFYKR